MSTKKGKFLELLQELRHPSACNEQAVSCVNIGYVFFDASTYWVIRNIKYFCDKVVCENQVVGDLKQFSLEHVADLVKKSHQRRR